MNFFWSPICNSDVLCREYAKSCPTYKLDLCQTHPSRRSKRVPVYLKCWCNHLKGWSHQVESWLTLHLVTEWVCWPVTKKKKSSLFTCTSTWLKQNFSVKLAWGFYCIIPAHAVPRSRWIRMSVGMTEAFAFTCSGAGIRTQSWVTIACPWRGNVHSVWLKKHLSRDLTLAADRDSDLCIILSVNTSHIAGLYSITVLKTRAPQQLSCESATLWCVCWCLFNCSISTGSR